MEIGVIGAGSAAAAATHVLDRALPDATVTVLEKSGGLGGRAATRRRGDVTYDYGANYIKDAGDRVVDLLTETLSSDGLVSIDERIDVFDADGCVSPGRESEHLKWTYRDGLTGIAKRLLSGTDATVHRDTRVETIQKDDRWRLVDSDGRAWGPFDVLLCSPPAPQAATLLRDADWDVPLRETLVEAIEAVEYRTIWTAVLGYEFELDVPYYALVNPGKDHEIGWISREECKPGHVPEGESVLIVQANHGWSVANLDAPPDQAINDLAELTAGIFGDNRLADPDWVDHQRWRHALPENGVARGPIGSAAEHDLYPIGDWVVGDGRVHAALLNGLETGEQVVNGQ